MVKLKIGSSTEPKSASAKEKPIKARNRRVSFRRYTNLAALMHLLQNRKITLLSPETWDDKNDAHFMAEYKQIKKIETVLAICFTEATETYHHWHVFSHGADGVCINFDREALLQAFSRQNGVKMGRVSYELVDTVAAWPELKADKLPFLKHKPYQPEREYRVIFEQESQRLEFFDMQIELDWIKSITLSPWMPRALQSAVTKTLKGIQGCENIKVVRSTLVGRQSWQALAAKAVP